MPRWLLMAVGALVMRCQGTASGMASPLGCIGAYSSECRHFYQPHPLQIQILQRYCCISYPITLSQPLLAQPGKTLSLQMRRRQASRNDRGAHLEPRAARKQNGKRAFISRRRGCIPLHGQVAAADFNSPSCGSEVKWRLTDCPHISMPELCRTRVCACSSATEKLRCLEVLLCAGARPKCSAQVAACVLIVPSRCASALRKWLFLSASSLN